MRDGVTPLLATKAGLCRVKEARYLQGKSRDGRKDGVRSETHTGHSTLDPVLLQRTENVATS